jgi:hypothetical protein
MQSAARVLLEEARARARHRLVLRDVPDDALSLAALGRRK